ncbi:MAG: ADP-ribose pyrophosphatase [Betaproteobacteria bacterium RBG_16_64_18]|nr:MAG: ADP-ribose pyrophosphatase [Betaproteobacteria bacterium RBG_16_64_18]OGA09118.1 MAG: ADP-ribose pyrophosphatase [Betaproteobacteria bacterium RIFCSPLOWO2_02_FULL_65_20]
MNFCSNCGARIVVRVPDGDTLPRHMCEACGTIHYRNPLVVVGSIPEWKDQVLLCKRAIEPRLGMWTLPAGFMELGESVAQGAIRETIEEANARVELGEMFTVLSVPHVNQVHIFYRAQLLDLDFGPGTESLEVTLFREGEIPWKELAFRTISMTLKHYYADRRQGAYRLHADEILAPRGMSA